MIIATVQLVLDCERGEAADAINELLREHQRQFREDSCLLDYAVSPIALPVYFLADAYEESGTFIQI